MGTYASDDSDDEGSVVSVVHHGELASVAERRATQIRHVLREGPPDSEEDTPPAVRARRGDLDPFSLHRRASSRVDARRGPSRLSRRGERHANRDRHVVWRDERTTEGDPEGFGSRQMDAYGSRRRSIRESSPPRYGDAYGDAYGAKPVADVRHYASPTLFAAPEFPELGRVASLARRYEDPRFFDASPRDPDVPEFLVGGDSRRSPAGFALDARNAETPKSGVDAAREALDDVARDLRDAHERSAQKIRALARAMDAREDRLAKSATELRDVQRRLANVLAAVDGDVSDPPGSVDQDSARRISISRADQLDARGVALRAAAAEKAAELRAKNEEERDREEAEASARVARARAERERAEAEAEAAAARAEAETARASAAFRPSAAAARDTTRIDTTRITPHERSEGGVPREAPAETPASPATRSASPRVSAEKEHPNRFEAERVADLPVPRVAPAVPPDLSRTRAGRPVPIPAKTTSDVVETTPEANANANAPSPAEVTPALTRAGRAAERTPPPAIPRERLVERFPEKTPTVSAVKTPAGALALSRTRQAIATVSAMKPPAGDKEKEAAGEGWTAGLTRAGRRVGPASPAAAFAPALSTGPEHVPFAAPTLRDGMSLITGADGAAERKRENASDAEGKTRPGESWRGLSRTRAFGGKTRPDFGSAVTSAAAASGLTFEASRPPVDPQAAAVAQSRMARTRR